MIDLIPTISSLQPPPFCSPGAIVNAKKYYREWQAQSANGRALVLSCMISLPNLKSYLDKLVAQNLPLLLFWLIASVVLAV